MKQVLKAQDKDWRLTPSSVKHRVASVLLCSGASANQIK